MCNEGEGRHVKGRDVKFWSRSGVSDIKEKGGGCTYGYSAVQCSTFSWTCLITGTNSPFGVSMAIPKVQVARTSEQYG
jgi:hypothetical protein